MNDGTAWTYEATGTEIVGPDAMHVVDQQPEHTATLFACHPKGSAAQRIVVHFRLAGQPRLRAEPRCGTGRRARDHRRRHASPRHPRRVPGHRRAARRRPAAVGLVAVAFAGVAALDRLIADRPSVPLAPGTLVGLGLYVPSLAWMTEMTLPGYVIAVVAYAALLGAAMALVPYAPGRWLALPGAVALTELLRWSWPFGGVPLSSLAVGQVGGPLAPVLRVGGALLLVEVTVIGGVALAAALRRRWAAAGLAAAVVLVAVGVAAVARGREAGTLRVALVQGGGPQGTRAWNTDEREVFERHLEASEQVDTPVDLVLWPEDVVDIDSLDTDRERASWPISPASWTPPSSPAWWRTPGGPVPQCLGGLRRRRRDRRPLRQGPPRAVRGVRAAPVAARAVRRRVADLRDAVVGDQPALLETPAGGLSVAISWEIFFGDRVREGVEQDAEVVLNPTNGSSFSGTLVQTQQVASSRMGHRERPMAAAGGAHRVQRGDRPRRAGHQRSAVSEQVVLHETVGRRTGTTLYTRWGLGPALAVAAGRPGGRRLVEARRRRRHRGPGAPEPVPPRRAPRSDRPPHVTAAARSAAAVPDGGRFGLRCPLIPRRRVPPRISSCYVLVSASWGGGRQRELQPGGRPGRDDLFRGDTPRTGHRALRDRRSRDDHAVALPRVDGSMLVGEAADQRSYYEPTLVARTVAPRLGEPGPIVIDGQAIDPGTLTEALIGTAIEQASRTGEWPGHLVLTYPLRHGGAVEDLLEQAVAQVTTSPVMLVPEPIAAMAKLAHDVELALDTTVVVIDFGGSSFDVTLVRRTSTGFDLIGDPVSLPDFGGVDVDTAVLAHVESMIGDVSSGVATTDHDGMLGLRRLRGACRAAKETLSSIHETVIDVNLPHMQGQVAIARDDLEQGIGATLTEAVDLIGTVVADAGLTIPDVHVALVVGGSSASRCCRPSSPSASGCRSSPIRCPS